MGMGMNMEVPQGRPPGSEAQDGNGIDSHWEHDRRPIEFIGPTLEAYDPTRGSFFDCLGNWWEPWDGSSGTAGR